MRGIDAAESRVRKALPIAHVIYLEPDVYEESRIDDTDPAIRTVQRASGEYDGPDYPRGTGPLPQPDQDGSIPVERGPAIRSGGSRARTSGGRAGAAGGR